MHEHGALKKMTKDELCALIIYAEDKAESEYKRAVFWEKDARKQDRDATNANTTVLQVKIEGLEADIKANEDERIVDIMTVRGEWNKSEAKHLDKIKALKLKVNQAEDQAKYWEETWGELAEDNLRDEHAEQKNTIALQAKIIKLLEK